MLAQLTSLKKEQDIEKEEDCRENCCFIFSLQTGALTVVVLDVAFFVLICAMSGLTFKTNVHGDGGHTTDQVDGTLFTFTTDGLLILLFFIKMVTGLIYLNKTLRPPSMDYQYIEELGKLKWHTRRIKQQRIHFKNYVLIANVTSVWILLQTVLLFLVLYDGTFENLFRYGFLIFVSLLQLFIIPKINQHGLELDEQVTYRIERHASFHTKYHEYQPPIN